jgi:nucleotide-binding universal stress UspA family protein
MSHYLALSGGSARAEVALEFAAIQAERTGGSVTVLTVVKSVTDEDRAVGIQAKAKEILARSMDPARVYGKIRIGHPAEEILAEAESGPYDLLVVGERQHLGLVTRFVLGSTAQRVVEHSPLPVVVAKGRIGPVRRILLCDSGVPDAPLVEQVSGALVELMRAAEQVTVLLVMSHMAAGPGVPDEDLFASVEDLRQDARPEGVTLERDEQALAVHGVKPVLVVRRGLVVEEVKAEARAHDLVVIGGHRGAGWRRLILGDVAHQILVEVSCPVLVVPVRS